MEATEALNNVIEKAVNFAVEDKNRYVTAEYLVYALSYDEEFINYFTLYGGDIEGLRTEVKDFLVNNRENSTDGEVEISNDFNSAVNMAILRAGSSGRAKADISHLVASVLELEDSYGAYFIQKQKVDLIGMLGDMSRGSIASDESRHHIGEGEDMPQISWKDYVSDMNELCLKQNELIGRKKELARTIQILCRRDKNNVIHLGEPGVGKTAIAYGLARLLVNNNVPDNLKGAKIYALDMSSMLSDTAYRGELEKRFKLIMNGLMQEEKPIVYIDEIHNIAGAGATAESSFDISNMLKPYLADGHIRFMGATTFAEFKKTIGKSRSLLRRFQTITVEEPSKDETVKILMGLKGGYEKFHGVVYDKDVFKYAVDAADKYMNDRFLPDKAIDLIDEAGAYKKLNPSKGVKQRVDKSVIDRVLCEICSVPEQTVGRNDAQILANLEDVLMSGVFGQEDAIHGVVNAVKFSRAGLNEENKPVASFLFVGPTGVGKTETARLLAKELGINLVRFDMSEYAEKHTVAKLIGSPAGYVGYEEGGLLTEEIRKHPHCVLLLDEIEKAHSDIYNILLQVMDYATLTDNQGNKADFKNVILIMTSNAGASEMGKFSIGFGASAINRGAVDEAVKRTFQPEFRNRLSGIVLFNSMSDKMALKIAEKKLNELAASLKMKNIKLSVSEEAIVAIKNKGITNQYGARELDRVIARDIKPLLVDEILFGKLKKGGSCLLCVKGEEFVLHIKKTL